MYFPFSVPACFGWKVPASNPDHGWTSTNEGKAKEFFDKGNTSDLPWEQYDGTTELMSVEENGGESVTEIYTDMGEIVYHDGKTTFLNQTT